MVHFGKTINKVVTISNKHNSITISYELPDETCVFSFDKEGRLWTALVDKIAYRRGLNGNIVAKWNSGKEVLHRKWLNDNERYGLITKSHHEIFEILNLLRNQQIIFNPDLDKQTISELDLLSKIDITFYEEDEKSYHSVYKPVGILPPDQYISVVLQLTEGCSFNKCTFCTFYRDRTFRIKPSEEFEQHIVNVKNFVGKGLSLRRTIFLGDANALVVPTRKLIPLLEIIHKHLDVAELGGLFAFLDGFSGEKKTNNEYKSLKVLGLEKIYVGLESGNDSLLKFLNKPGTANDAVSAVQQIKTAGISVGIIVLLGAGGKRYQEGHIRDTINIINKMNLDADDLIYFSELIESEGLDYSKRAFSTNLEPLSSQERFIQRQKIEQGLIFANNDSPHISTYDIRDFVY
ncbi:MAG TPA: radical SAM protein [Anaerolineaceae bacterium]|nr:radical SAM protein [Anaerolineaceae bacterium]